MAVAMLMLVTAFGPYVITFMTMSVYRFRFSRHDVCSALQIFQSFLTDDFLVSI
jgi:hypothetical protein